VKGEKGARDKVTKMTTKKGGVEWGGAQGLYLDICAGAPEFLVTPLLMGPVCLLSQGRFEEQFRPWKHDLNRSKANNHLVLAH